MPGSKRYYVGTFYAHGDSYHHMAGRGVKLRLHPCYEVDYEKSQIDDKSGLPLSLVHDETKPVLYSGEHLAKEAKLIGTGYVWRADALRSGTLAKYLASSTNGCSGIHLVPGQGP